MEQLRALKAQQAHGVQAMQQEFHVPLQSNNISLHPELRVLFLLKRAQGCDLDKGIIRTYLSGAFILTVPSSFEQKCLS